MRAIHKYPKLTAEEAAELVDHKETVAFSEFTAAGAAKAVPMAIADLAKQIHAKGAIIIFNIKRILKPCNNFCNLKS
jgi:acyl-CoA hydrolase